MKNIRVSGGKELLDIQDILENRLGIVYGAKVADLGCGGNGFFTFKVARLVGKTGLVYAVDGLKMVLNDKGGVDFIDPNADTKQGAGYSGDKGYMSGGKSKEDKKEYT